MIKDVLSPRFYKPALMTILSCTILYFINLKSVVGVNYGGMIDFWSVGYSFVDFNHPMRLFIRFGETILINNKLGSFFTGFLMFAPFLTYLINKKNFKLKLFYLLPILSTILASALHKYPIQARLVLFLAPIFCIIWAYAYKTFELWIKYLLLVAIFCSYLFFNFPIYSYGYDACGREITSYLMDNIKREDVFLIDAYTEEYMYYITTNGFQNKSIKMPNSKKEDTDFAVNYVKTLPKGTYYIMVGSMPVKKLLDLESIKVIKVFKNFDRIKAIYFEVL